MTMRFPRLSGIPTKKDLDPRCLTLLTREKPGITSKEIFPVTPIETPSLIDRTTISETLPHLNLSSDGKDLKEEIRQREERLDMCEQVDGCDLTPHPNPSFGLK